MCKKYIEFIVLNLIYKFLCLINRQVKVVLACNFERDIYLNLTCLYNQLLEKDIGKKTEFLLSNSKTILSLLKQLWVFSKSKIIFVDCSHWVVSKLRINPNTKLIYVGHGGGVYKKMGYAANHDRKIPDFKKKLLYGQFSYVVATTKNFDQQICLNYSLDPDQILHIGLPRTDMLFSSTPAYSYNKKLLLAPSFIREKGVRRYQWDFNKLKYILSSYEVWISLHPDVQQRPLIPENWKVFDSTTHYEDLRDFDILITDGSSIMFDFSITKKPVILFDFSIRKNIWSDVKLEGLNIVHDYSDLKLMIDSNSLIHSDLLYRNQMSCCTGKSSKKLINFSIGLYNE